MNRNILPKNKLTWMIAGLVAIAAVAAISAVLMSSDKKDTSVPQAAAVPTAEVRITNKGFEPATLSIRPGTKVIWVNADKAMHQVASNPHPTHEDLPGLVSTILNQQQFYEYTFDQAGSYKYHDEQQPTSNGTVEVGN